MHINLRYVTSHTVLIDKLSPAFAANLTDEVHFIIDLNRRFMFSDYWLLIAAAVKHLRGKGITTSGSFLNFEAGSDIANYASRVNFFELVGFEYDENFCRRNARGRFTEIVEFNECNSIEIFNDIMKILIGNNTNEDMLTVLNSCLWEVIDNTLNHSGQGFTYGAGSGFICAQFFPQHEQIRIMIADTGIGIHKALTTHPDSKFKGLNEMEAVSRSVEKGVTNSQGMGFGLWATSEMIKQNQGSLMIHSGVHQLNSGSTGARELSNWQGTMTFLVINTNIPVDYRLIFGKGNDYEADFLELKEKFFGNNDELW